MLQRKESPNKKRPTQTTPEIMSIAQGSKILVVNTSGRTATSTSRKMTSMIAEGFKTKYGATVTERDVGNSKIALPTVNDAMIDSFFAQSERTESQKAAVALSDELVAEVVAADVLIVGVPMYNFGPAASLKVYADLIARAGLTFTYGSAGPEGLLKNKKVFFVVTAGGVPLGSPMDHLSPWLKTFFNFIGISDQTTVEAIGQGDAGLKAGVEAVEKLLA
jgi:FMN-dependent NADH-azoreductase